MGLRPLVAMALTCGLASLECGRSGAATVPPAATIPVGVASVRAPESPVPSKDGPAQPCRQETKPTQLAIVDAEVFVVGDAGTIMAIPVGGGSPRVVACGFAGGIAAIARADHALLVLDGGQALWRLSTDGGARRRVAAEVHGFAALGQDVAFGRIVPETGQVIVSLASGSADAGTERELTRVTPPELQRAVVGAGGGGVFVARSKRWPPSSDWETTELARVPLAGRPGAAWAMNADSVVSRLETDGAAVVWYATGYRGSSWGGGYGACELVVSATPRHVRTLRSFNPAPGDACDDGLVVWFVLDGDSVIYRTSKEDVLWTQPMRRGPARRLAAVPREALGLDRDAAAVYWLGTDGTLGRLDLATSRLR